jgi:hypothetical protein
MPVLWPHTKSPPTPTHELINETYKGYNTIFVQTDASDEEAIEALITKAVSWSGRLDSMRKKPQQFWALRLTRTQ